MGVTTPARINVGLARYTLTSFGDRIYARIGQPPPTAPPMTRMGIRPDRPTSPSFVVAVDRSAQGKLLWKREASEIALPKRRPEGGVGSRNAVFEGSPVADARNVYVALTDRIEMTATYVACLDAETGSTRWVRYICEANSNIDPFLRRRPRDRATELLTLDGPTGYVPDQPRRRGVARRRDRERPLAGHLPLAGPERRRLEESRVPRPQPRLSSTTVAW